MSDLYSKDELLALGFSSVGDDTLIARDVKFFAIEGSIGDRVRIDTYAILTGHIELGDDTHVSPFCFLSATGGKITMGAGSGIGPQVSLLTKSDDYNSEDLGDKGKLSGDISIGERTILGAGCKVLPGATVGSDASIGSNCVITSDVKAGDQVVSRGAALITVGNRLES